MSIKLEMEDNLIPGNLQPMPHDFLKLFRRIPQGFTLLELSIVIIIIGVLVASMIPMATQTALKAKNQEVAAKMNAIEEALENYRMANNRLPCPAQAVADNNANFGVTAANAGSCTGGTPAATVLISSPADSAVVQGMVPVVELGLPTEYAFDTWGRAFSYVVDQRITATDAFTTYDVNDTDIGNITVTELQNGAAGAQITDKAVVALISFGPNGHGGVLNSGSVYSASSSNTYEQANCFCDASADDVAPSSVNIYEGITTSSTAGTTSKFDDIVHYYVRSSFVTEQEIEN